MIQKLDPTKDYENITSKIVTLKCHQIVINISSIKAHIIIFLSCKRDIYKGFVFITIITVIFLV